MSSDLAIIGATRFSLIPPAKDGGPSIDESRRAVFSLRRMRRRFRLFRALALPSIDAIARRCPHFTHLFLVSNDLPLFWRAQLRWHLYRRPWCRVVWIDPGEPYKQKLIAAVDEVAAGRRYYTFRFDDDDAIGAGWLPAVLAAAQKEGDFVLSFDNGFYLRGSIGGFKMAPLTYPKIAIGLGYFSSARPAKTIYCLGNHTRLHEKAEVVNVSSPPCWIRSIHDASLSGDRSNSTALPSKQSVSALTEHFPHLEHRRLGRAFS